MAQQMPDDGGAYAPGSILRAYGLLRTAYEIAPERDNKILQDLLKRFSP